MACFVGVKREDEELVEVFFVPHFWNSPAAESANEPAVGNFLQDILDQHQKHSWMLRSFTK
jgi:hypothetical protein